MTAVRSGEGDAVLGEEGVNILMNVSGIGAIVNECF